MKTFLSIVVCLAPLAAMAHMNADRETFSAREPSARDCYRAERTRQAREIDLWSGRGNVKDFDRARDHADRVCREYEQSRNSGREFHGKNF